MQIGLMILVLLAALVTIASGVWVAVALMAAVGRTKRPGDAPSEESASRR
jgi:hypothetical protein